MDLGIKGRRAIVCASSKGLGRGVAEKLAEAGVNLTLNARTESTLRATADEIAGKYGVAVQIVAEDVTTEAGRLALLRAEPNADILINNAGGPPPGVWSDWGEEEWLQAVNNNMLTPTPVLTNAILPGMIERKWGRVVNITSGSVKSPIAQLGLSNAARSGLTGFVAGNCKGRSPDTVSSSTICCPDLTIPIGPKALSSAPPLPRKFPWRKLALKHMREIRLGVTVLQKSSALLPPFCAASSPASL